MRATLYRVNGETRLTVGDFDGDAVEGEVVDASEIDVDPEEVFAFLAGSAIGEAPVPTIEEVTDAFDPWLAWYGGSDRGCHAVVYGRKDEHDRKVSFRETDGGYEVTLEFGRVANVPDHRFEPAEVPPIVVTTGSRIHAKRAFNDFCTVT